MRLVITTPVSIVVDAEDVRHVRAEDETGAFGVLPGHAELITVLTISVITWRDRLDQEHHAAVRGGVLSVRGGELVEIATRQAVGEETLERLGDAVLRQFREEEQAEEVSRVTAARLHVAAIKGLQRYLDSGRPHAPAGQRPSPGAAPAGGASSSGGGLE